MVRGKRRALSGQQRVAEAFASLDDHLLGARDGVHREGDAGQFRLDHALDDHAIRNAATSMPLRRQYSATDRRASTRDTFDGLLHLRQRAKVQQRAELPGKRGVDAILAGRRRTDGEGEPQCAHRGGQIRRRAIERRHRKTGALQLEEHASLARRRSRAPRRRQTRTAPFRVSLGIKGFGNTPVQSFAAPSALAAYGVLGGGTRRLVACSKA